MKFYDLFSWTPAANPVVFTPLEQGLIEASKSTAQFEQFLSEHVEALSTIGKPAFTAAIQVATARNLGLIASTLQIYKDTVQEPSKVAPAPIPKPIPVATSPKSSDDSNETEIVLNKTEEELIRASQSTSQFNAFLESGTDMSTIRPLAFNRAIQVASDRNLDQIVTTLRVLIESTQKKPSAGPHPLSSLSSVQPSLENDFIQAAGSTSSAFQDFLDTRAAELDQISLEILQRAQQAATRNSDIAAMIGGFIAAKSGDKAPPKPVLSEEQRIEDVALSFHTEASRKKYSNLSQGSIPYVNLKRDNNSKPIHLHVEKRVVVRGNGNCYYRSVYIEAIGNYIMAGNRQAKFQALAQKLHNITPAMKADGLDEEAIAAHEKLIQFVNDAANGTRWLSPQEFEKALLSDPTLDHSFVYACRYLAAEGLLNVYEKLEVAEKYAFLVGLDAYVAVDGMELDASFALYNKNSVKTMDVDAEGLLVEDGILFKILDVHGGIVNVRGAAAFLPCNLPEGVGPEILILQTTGHYDILRSKQLVEKRTEALVKLEDDDLGGMCTIS